MRRSQDVAEEQGASDRVVVQGHQIVAKFNREGIEWKSTAAKVEEEKRASVDEVAAEVKQDLNLAQEGSDEADDASF